MHNTDGLYPYSINMDGPTFANDVITFGAMADSFYEYLLKCWLQGGRKENNLRKMYDKAMDGVHNNLLFTTRHDGLTYLADMNGGRINHKMDHLACFMAGSLALGAYTHPDGLESAKAQRDLKTGKALAYTCYQMYARMKTGISPEAVNFNSGSTDFQPHLATTSSAPKRWSHSLYSIFLLATQHIVNGVGRFSRVLKSIVVPMLHTVASKMSIEITLQKIEWKVFS